LAFRQEPAAKYNFGQSLYFNHRAGPEVKSGRINLFHTGYLIDMAPDFDINPEEPKIGY